MMLRPYYTKIRLKSKELAHKLRRPTRVLPIEQFFFRHWQGKLPGADYFSSQAGKSFFFDPNASIEYQKALRAEFPKSCDRIIRRADKAAGHIVDILGSGERSLGDKIDWHRDFKSGKRWEPKHFANIRLVDLDDNSDVKIPWEISRLQFLTELGRAFWLTGNPVYRNEFADILTDWEDSNPIDIGVNWTCSMEIAIRAINIIWGLHYFAEDIDDNFTNRIIRLLYYHGLHIEKNLEIITSGANSNHLISDYLGLYYLGLLFPEFDRAKNWRNIGIKGLENEICEQVMPDGADYECSSSYHRLVLEMFLSAFILGRINEVTFSDSYKNRLRKMIDFSLAMTPSSGYAPLIGDNDDGFVVRLSTDNPADHRPLIEVGLLIFGERVPNMLPMSEERLWYLGPQSLNRFQSHVGSSSRLFSESGYGIIRSADFHLVFNYAGIPPKGLGGHKHNDLLSFTLEIGGVPFLIDPGTYCYSADYKMRNLSRTTSFHNTVTIDGQEQNRFFERRLFYLFRDAVPKLNLWADAGDCVVASAKHSGYSRLSASITHKRTIWVSLATHSIKILDDFTGNGNGAHTFDLNFISPLRDIGPVDLSSTIIGGQKEKQIILKVSGENLKNREIKAIDYFPRYGVKEDATLIKYTFVATLPFQITTSIAPNSRHLSIHDQMHISGWDLSKRFEKAGIPV